MTATTTGGLAGDPPRKGQAADCADGAAAGCPQWCATDHEHAKPGSVRESVHIAAEARISAPAGDVRVCAWWSGYDSSPPDVFLSLPVDSRLSVPPASAGGLAALLEVLATATPEQHREIAAAIRHAAVVLAEDS